jgi:hypothetical protein
MKIRHARIATTIGLTLATVLGSAAFTASPASAAVVSVDVVVTQAQCPQGGRFKKANVPITDVGIEAQWAARSFQRKQHLEVILRSGERLTAPARVADADWQTLIFTMGCVSRRGWAGAMRAPVRCTRPWGECRPVRSGREDDRCAVDRWRATFVPIR